MTKKAGGIISNKPKRPASAYIRFTSDENKNEDEQRKEEGSAKMTIQERATRNSKKWLSLPEDEKKKYIESYQKDMAEYHKAMEAFKNTDEYKEMQAKKNEEKRQAATKGKKPKKPRNQSPYNVFMSEMYNASKSGDGAYDFKRMASEASAKWKIMSEDAKEVYKKKADEKNKARKEKEELANE